MTMQEGSRPASDNSTSRALAQAFGEAWRGLIAPGRLRKTLRSTLSAARLRRGRRRRSLNRLTQERKKAKQLPLSAVFLLSSVDGRKDRTLGFARWIIVGLIDECMFGKSRASVRLSSAALQNSAALKSAVAYTSNGTKENGK
jgi:hypothetical protein